MVINQQVVKLKKTLRYSYSNLKMQYHLLTSERRQAPDFIVIGVVKGGTTSFYENLVSHPQVESALVKEIHFFDRHFSKTERWYHAHFPLRAHGGNRRLTGEATPDYLFYPFVAERVARQLPNAKFIVLLRNPVSRAYSHFHMHTRMGKDQESVEATLRRELAFLQTQTIDRSTFERFSYDRLGAQAALDYPRDQYAVKSSAAQPGQPAPYPETGLLLRGFYAEQLAIWFDHFPREQFLILKSEDYFANPARILKDVVPPFLELSGWEPDYRPARNQNKSYPKIDGKLRDELAAFFKPYNEKLYALLGVDYGW